MSNARNRKRRHSTAFSEQPINGEQDAEPKEDTPPVDGDNAQSSNGVVLDEEQEELIRNAVREEHVESEYSTRLNLSQYSNKQAWINWHILLAVKCL